MKRDWEIVRKILVELENLGDSRSLLLPGNVVAFDEQNVNYHIQILSEAGLIEAERHGGEIWVGRRLTWQGHDLLDHMRDQGTWNKVRAVIREKGLEVSVDAVKLAASMLVYRAFR